MNLIEKWKNRETKKSLREENIRLKAQVEMLHRVKPPVCTIERNVQKVYASFTISQFVESVPAEFVKERILDRLSLNLSDFVEYDFLDDKEGRRMYIGTLYVATGNRKQ